MKRIGGNVDAELQVRSVSVNEIGETVEEWTTSMTLHGFLDLQSGDSRYLSYNRKTQESTHVFVCDYVDLGPITAEDSMLVVDGRRYDVTMIDDPMNLHYQLEFSLRYVGGDDGR